MEVQGKVAVVTGAARGIGEALCRAFAAAGAEAVIAADVDPNAANLIACDVSRRADIDALVRQVLDRYGRIDLFCSNAGIFGPHGAALDIAVDDFQRVYEVNVLSHLYAAQAVLPHMLARGEGYLLQTVSAAGLLNQVNGAAYGVSKHAAIGLAESLSIEYGDRGIRVSCLCPQGVRTRMLDDAGPDHFLQKGSLSVDEVAAVTLQGLAEEKFLILPHPEVAEYMRRKAADYDRWLRGMRRLKNPT